MQASTLLRRCAKLTVAVRLWCNYGHACSNAVRRIVPARARTVGVRPWNRDWTTCNPPGCSVGSGEKRVPARAVKILTAAARRGCIFLSARDFPTLSLPPLAAAGAPNRTKPNAPSVHLCTAAPPGASAGPPSLVSVYEYPVDIRALFAGTIALHALQSRAPPGRDECQPIRMVFGSMV